MSETVSKIKIIDGFMFYNEIDLLMYRLSLLYNTVDYFIIIESTLTHTGLEKKLYYNENKHLFEKFSDKIIHIIIDDFEYKKPEISKNEQWLNEHFQRDCVVRGFNNITLYDNDLIIISDLDEIPDPHILNIIKKDNIPIELYSLEMDLYYYNLNTKMEDKWYYPKIISYKTFKQSNKTPSFIRYLECDYIKNGGWHLSYFGDSKHIKNKIISFTHQEHNIEEFTNLDKIENRIKNGQDLFNRNVRFIKLAISDNQYLPPEYDKFLTKYYT